MLMVKENIVPETSIITQSTIEREKLASTAIGDGVAIPHCKSGLVKDVFIVCGVLKNPINWNSPDGIPVQLLFLIVSPEEKPQMHLEALKLIAGAVSSPDFKENVEMPFNKNKLLNYFHSLYEV